MMASTSIFFFTCKLKDKLNAQLILNKLYKNRQYL